MKEGTAKKAKKGLFHVVFSRTAIIFMLLIVQVLIFIGIIQMMEDYKTQIYVLFIVISVIVVIEIINSNDNPAFKMAWIIPIMVLPIVGAAFYIYVKLQVGTKYMGRRLRILGEETKPYMEQDADVVERLKMSKPANANLSYYMFHQVGFPTYRNTSVKYFPLGEDKFKELVRQLEMAEQYIFMEYFIVEEGRMWNTTFLILEKKVRQGVEVRFMYDGMCSIAMLPYNYPKTLRKLGTSKQFNSVKPILSTEQNNRDHRKICVIDGRVAFTGVNLADEYINVKRAVWSLERYRCDGRRRQSRVLQCCFSRCGILM